MIVRCHRVSKLHNIFQNTYLVGLFVMHIFSVIVEIPKKNTHIYPFGTLSLIAMGYRQHFGKNHAKQISTEKEPGFTPLGVKRLFFM